MSLTIKSARAYRGDPAAFGIPITAELAAGEMGDAMNYEQYVAENMMGDPGLFGLIGKGIKTVGRIAGAAARLTPVGRIAAPLIGAAGGLIAGTGAKKLTQRALPGSGLKSGQIPRLPAGPPRAAAPQVPAARDGRRPFPRPKGKGPPGPGYRLNKSGYYRRNPAGQTVYIKPQSVWVKSRRRNPLNPRALDRAIGRVGSAKRAAKKLGRITIRKKC